MSEDEHAGRATPSTRRPGFRRFRLNAGTWLGEATAAGIERRVQPASIGLFDQIVAYLEAQPYVPLSRISTHDHAVATVAVCLRWGSYFSVVADRTKPMWSEARNQRVSLIADPEMMRINIESSSALERWLEIWRTDQERWHRLVAQAVHYLPMETRTVQRDRDAMLGALAHADVAAEILPLIRPDLLAARQQEVRNHPSRVLANAIINRAWRNGAVEDVHAGFRQVGPPLERCRLSLRDCRTVLRSTLGSVADAMWAMMAFEYDPERRSWEEQVLPYHVADQLIGIGGWLITPSEWSLTERTCRMVLPGSEAEARQPVQIAEEQIVLSG